MLDSEVTRIEVAMKTLILFLLLTISARAEDSAPSSAFTESLSRETEVFTKESIVEISGVKFRKVEYKSKVYHLQLLEPERPNQDLQMKCDTAGEASLPQPALTHVEAKITRRTALFVEGLKVACQEMTSGRQKVGINDAIRIGFIFKDDPKDLIKKKQIYITPGLGLGFAGEW